MKNKEQKEEKTLKSEVKQEKLREKCCHTERKKYKIELLICLIYAVLIQIYFVTLDRVVPIPIFSQYVKISYIVFTLITIIMFEIAYRKNKNNFIITGIEFILLAIHVLLLEIDKEQISILTTSYIWPIYYCLKAIIIYTQENRRRLKQISDISEIVKEEKPTKKVAKKRKK